MGHGLRFRSLWHPAAFFSPIAVPVDPLWVHCWLSPLFGFAHCGQEATPQTLAPLDVTGPVRSASPDWSAWLASPGGAAGRNHHSHPVTTLLILAPNCLLDVSSTCGPVMVVASISVLNPDRGQRSSQMIACGHPVSTGIQCHRGGCGLEQ